MFSAEARQWPRRTAIAKLADAATRLPAALRLAQLAGFAPAGWVASPADEKLTSRLRLAELDKDRWVLGLADAQDERLLHSPLLVDRDGDVIVAAHLAGSMRSEAAEITDSESAAVFVSRDSEVFPHLLIADGLVINLAQPDETALALRNATAVEFALRFRNDYPYVALLSRGGGSAEVARYTWDPYELMLSGPAADKLPDPPGGRFEMDMDHSPALNPVGGEIPKPPPTPVPTPPDDEPPLY